MNEDQRQRQMDFILAQQAKHEAEIAEIRALTKETREDLSLYINQNIVVQRAVVAIIEKETERSESISRLDQALTELTERLNTFINVVERHITEGSH
jgi:hypothetical protein